MGLWCAGCLTERETHRLVEHVIPPPPRVSYRSYRQSAAHDGQSGGFATPNNRFIPVILSLPVGTGDTIERLLEVHRRTVAMKEHQDLLLSILLCTRVLASLPPWLWRRLLGSCGPRRSTHVLCLVAYVLT